MRWLGGISIDRAKSHNVVNETVRQYREHESLVILIPPEGTRSKVTTWKSGFYHIANNANVPIMMGYIDAATKEAGLADLFHPTGNLKQDIREIRAFYSKKIGLRAENS
jgi:1-acyl-sn-glycerol-3-phosphate acyltransferase